MSDWTNEPQIIPEGRDTFPGYASPATIQIAPGEGTVQLQQRNPAGIWETFESLVEAGIQKIDVVNMPAIRVVATGNAQFRLTWS